MPMYVSGVRVRAQSRPRSGHIESGLGATLDCGRLFGTPASGQRQLTERSTRLGIPLAAPFSFSLWSRRSNSLTWNRSVGFEASTKTARGRLAAVLTDLDPLFRRLPTGEHCTDGNHFDWMETDARRDRQFQAADRACLRLLCSVCKGPLDATTVYEFWDNTRREVILYERPRAAGGRPPKTLEERRAVRISIDAAYVMRRIKPDFKEVQRLKRQRRYRGDPDAIDNAICRTLADRYPLPYIQAMISGNTPRSVTAHLLSESSEKPISHIQANITRGDRLRRQAGPQRRRSK